MENLKNWGDRRQLERCVYCGGPTATRDHVPSRVLLDEPLPPDLPVVPACIPCNNGFSLDEEYVACLVECAVSRSTVPEKVGRKKVKHALCRSPGLVARLQAAWLPAADAFRVEIERVRNIALKLGRGHAAFELNEPLFEEPTTVNVWTLAAMNRADREMFETAPQAPILPEVGSRAMQRTIILSGTAGQQVFSQWVEVQPERYRYMASSGLNVVVRVVLSEYLGIEVVWKD